MQAQARLYASDNSETASRFAFSKVGRPHKGLSITDLGAFLTRYDAAFKQAWKQLAARSPRHTPSERSGRIHVCYDPVLLMTLIVRRDGFRMREDVVMGGAVITRDFHGDILSLTMFDRDPEEGAELLRRLAKELDCSDLAIAADWLHTGWSVLLLPRNETVPDVPRPHPIGQTRCEQSE